MYITGRYTVHRTEFKRGNVLSIMIIAHQVHLKSEDYNIHFACIFKSPKQDWPKKPESPPPVFFYNLALALNTYSKKLQRLGECALQLSW